MTSPMASSTTQTISTVVFGIVAIFISIITVWQSYKAWRLWLDHNQQAEPRALGDALAVIGSEPLLTSADLELGVLGDDHPAELPAVLVHPPPQLAPISAPVPTSSDGRIAGEPVGRAIDFAPEYRQDSVNTSSG